MLRGVSNLKRWHGAATAWRSGWSGLLLLCLCCAPLAAAERLRLATTTSTENSGLLQVLNAPFEAASGVRVDVIAVGSGKALQLAENGDVDLVLAHAPDAEAAFMAAGYGSARLPVMHNDFILLGPASDPAGVRAAADTAQAMRAIQAAAAGFVSRGDQSGTHARELELWRGAGIVPRGDWYLETGQGMGAVLQISNDKQAYTLSDRGTWLAYRGRLELAVVFEGSTELLNPYHVLLVDPRRHPHVQAALARRYADYIRGPEGQRVIREFNVSGMPLFHPDVIP